MKKQKRLRHKVTKGQIRKWRFIGTLAENRRSKATQKGHVHVHGETAWASVGSISLAEYRRRSKKKSIKAKNNTRYGKKLDRITKEYGYGPAKKKRVNKSSKAGSK